MTESPREKCRAVLQELYGAQVAGELGTLLERRLAEFEGELGRSGMAPEDPALSERDAILITYGDMLQERGVAPLRSLADFAHAYLEGVVSGMHILPFFPWSSDDGFSVIDYRKVDPELGTWQDIQRIGGAFRLMVDAVVNHISAESDWFRGFLAGDPRNQETFIVPGAEWDFSRVVRPRTSPLLTSFETAQGQKRVWTTFSADQVDLNYHHPALLFEIIELMLFYILQGAQFIRLDAIAFIWKESGTTCLHLPQVHLIVQLLRAIFDWVAPYVRIITETNVPHADNVAYFGDGTNEAHLVYNFSLPPLTLHTLLSGDCRALSEWAAQLRLPSERATFFNFLASHDGVGLNPARGILSEQEIEALLEKTRQRGGLIGSKTNPDGRRSPYELNVNYYDALNDPAADEALEMQTGRFICSQAIMLAMVGLPGIYFHSLVGSRGWPEGVEIRGYPRAINRQKLGRAELEAELRQENRRRSMVFRAYAHLLRRRACTPAFDPFGVQQVIDCGPAVFCLLRRSRRAAAQTTVGTNTEAALCLHNVTARPQTVTLDAKKLGFTATRLTNLVSGGELQNNGEMKFHLQPYQVAWWQGI